MFTFNRNLDRFILKPVAYVYNLIMPEPFQVMIANGFDNIKFVPRMITNLLQAKWGGASRELGRFLINSTFGIGGLFDPAKDYWGSRRVRKTSVKRWACGAVALGRTSSCPSWSRMHRQGPASASSSTASSTR